MGTIALSIASQGEASLALDLPKDQTFDEWVETGRNLASANKVLQWWIGDWWAAGSHRYGERARVAASGIFGVEFQSLMDLASVCRAFPTSRRRETLSFTHHREVAGLEPTKADELLERAESDGWSTRDIRAEAAVFRKAPAGGNTISGDARAEAYEWSALVGTWRRTRPDLRERFLGSLRGIEFVE